MLNKLYKLSYIAFRNLFRNKRRTLFTLLIATTGFAAMSIAVGYYSYSMYGLQELTIRSGFSGSGGTGHIQIRSTDFYEKPEAFALQHGLDDHKSLIDDILSFENIDYVMPRLEFGGLISNGDKSLPFIGFGINPEFELKLWQGFGTVNPSLKGGNEFSSLINQKHGVILGTKLANLLNATKGDTLMLYGTTVDGGVNAVDVELVNVIATGISEADKYYLLVNVPLAQQLINTSKISLLSIMFKDRIHLETKITTLKNEALKNQAKVLAVKDWIELGEYYASVRDLFNIIFLFMGSIIIVIVMLSCWNITNMTVLERIKEIGTLRAIGIKTRYITTIFLIENFLISIVGVITGFFLQLAISSIINRLLIPMPPIPGMNKGYFLQVYTYTDHHPLIALTIIIALTLSGLSAFFTIRKLSIIESLDHA